MKERPPLELVTGKVINRRSTISAFGDTDCSFLTLSCSSDLAEVLYFFNKFSKLLNSLRLPQSKVTTEDIVSLIC